MAMGSQAARGFQWTTCEKRAPPPLPSLPPWASPAAPPAALPSMARAVSGESDAHPPNGWRRPTSYFGAMKRLPAQSPSTESDDAHDDEERRRFQHSQQQHQQQPQDDADARREWLYGSRSEPAETAASPPSVETTNQREHDEPASQGADSHSNDNVDEPPSAAEDRSSGPRTPVVQPLHAEDAYFRPWRHVATTSASSNNDSHDDQDDAAAAANKWKVRALFNPFAKRKPTKQQPPPMPPAEPEQPEPSDTLADDNPAEPSPNVRVRAVAQAPRSRRSSVANKRRDAANNNAVPAPHRPRTPVPAPAPVSMQPEPVTTPLAYDGKTPQVSPAQASSQHQKAPVRPLRSRETMQLAQLATPPSSLRLSGDDSTAIPAALASLTDLRKSTAQLTPLQPIDQRIGGRADLRSQAKRTEEQEEDDDDDAVAKVLKSVPPKPPTQLQQLRQQQQQHKQKAKKGATLDALNEIKRRRDERRNAQAEEKQRLKTELEEHGDDAGYKFRRLIQRYRDALPAHQRPGEKATAARPAVATSAQRLCVFVRKRPLAKKEIKAKGYDILSCLFAAKTAPHRTELLCHEPKLKVDCSEALENHAFHFDGVFDDDQDNAAVYATTVGPLVPFLVAAPSSGASATSLTVFAYGQTGSGKTYTMKSIYREAAGDLFARLGARVSVGVSFYEIYMNQVNDLLNRRTRVQLLEDGDGVVQLLGLKEVAIASADELMELIAIGEESRATSANAVHDDSSRSHALLRVTLYGSDGGAVLARLSMVDLAGSERACDTQSDAKSTRMEGAEINKSLLALKECIRALDRGAAHIPFRQSKLTQLLRDSFLCANSKTVMIATVSPWSESCNHTLNTLRYADRLKEIGGAN